MCVCVVSNMEGACETTFLDANCRASPRQAMPKARLFTKDNAALGQVANIGREARVLGPCGMQQAAVLSAMQDKR